MNDWQERGDRNDNEREEAEKNDKRENKYVLVALAAAAAAKAAEEEKTVENWKQIYIQIYEININFILDSSYWFSFFLHNLYWRCNDKATFDLHMPRNSGNSL